MDSNKLSFENHPGVVDYKVDPCVIGFDYGLLWAKLATHYERRSICLGKMTYNADGTIQKLPFWTTQALHRLDL